MHIYNLTVITINNKNNNNILFTVYTYIIIYKYCMTKLRATDRIVFNATS